MNVEDVRLLPAQAFVYLQGEWRVERRVTGIAEQLGTLMVRASAPGQARYSERVRVRTSAGATFAGSQQYDVRQTENGFSLWFADTGSLFEDVQFRCDVEGGLTGVAVHLCGDDRYESEYVLKPGREFTVCHDVRGPRKGYVSLTRFTPTEGDEPSGSAGTSEGQ